MQFDGKSVMLAGLKGDAGTDGKTPFIGENGNWWIGDTDTGVPAAGSSTDPNAVHFTSQTLTDEQKAQARTNIGAAASADLDVLESDVNTALAGKASTADLAGKADQSDVDDIIDGTTPVAKATNADSATNATHATSADSATNAASADYATSAGSASTATNATHATSADSATKATQDGQGRNIASTYATKAEASGGLKASDLKRATRITLSKNNQNEESYIAILLLDLATTFLNLTGTLNALGATSRDSCYPASGAMQEHDNQYGYIVCGVYAPNNARLEVVYFNPATTSFFDSAVYENDMDYSYDFFDLYEW